MPLNIECVCKACGNQARLDDVRFYMKTGGWVGFVDVNGCGKEARNPKAYPAVPL